MDKDENAIRELVNRWLAASKAGDINTLLTLMAEDVLFLVPGREPFGKDLFAASAQAMKDVKIEGTSEIKELKIIGDWAWMRNRLVMTLRSGYTLTILRKKPDGSWVVARDANLLP